MGNARALPRHEAYHRAGASMHEEKETPVAMTHEQVKELTGRVAAEMKAASASLTAESLTGTGGGSRHRGLPEDLRNRFIAVRTALFDRGIFDPVLVRFDTATVSQASTAELGEHLTRIEQAM